MENGKSHFRPLRDYVLIAPLPEREGLVKLIRWGDKTTINDTDGDYRRQIIAANVIAVGPRVTGFKVGARVLASNWNDWEGEPHGYHLIREGDIAAVLPNGRGNA